jgi:plastocyanin
MNTMSRTALAGLLLAIVGCSSAPTRDSGNASGTTTNRTPALAEPARAQEPMADAMPAIATAPVPAPKAPAARADRASAPMPAAVETAAAPATPAPRPVPARAPVVAARPAPTAKPVPPPPVTATAGSISGTLKLVAGAGQSVSVGEVGEGLVYFLPKAGSPKPRPGRFKVATRAKGFIPETLVVPQGSTVAFPNVDTIIHNVYSRSPGNSFDLGYYGPGQSPEYTFRTAGLAIVNCTVHHTMRANVVVLATPYYARPGKDGRYRIDGVPPGPGTLVFWHPRAVARSVQASAPLAPAATQTLVASKSPQMH